MEREKREEALERLRMLLGIEDNERDGLLFFLIDDTVDMILGYCRIEILPRQLESLVPVIAADSYRAKGYGQTDAPEVVKSISEGERSITFENIYNTDDFIKEYETRLKPFINRSGRVPSDI